MIETQEDNIVEDEELDYQTWTDNNLRAREQFFAQLNAPAIADDLVKLESQSQRRRRTAAAPKVTKPRKSPRISTHPPVNYCESSDREFDSVLSPVEEMLKNCAIVKMEASSNSSFKNGLASNNIQLVSSNFEVRSVTNFSKILSTPTSIAIHPCEEKIIAALGNSSGQISIFAEGLYQLYDVVHNQRQVSGLHFNRTGLISAGRDGCLMRLDFNRPDLGFESLHLSNDSINGICPFQDNSSMFWLAQKNGLVLFDQLNRRNNIMFPIGKIQSVSSFDSKHLVCTTSRRHSASSSNRCLSIWDTRMLSNDENRSPPLVSSPLAAKPMSASFAPHDPSTILCHNSAGLLQLFRLDEANKTLRSTFIQLLPSDAYHRPIWHPNFRHAIIVGSPEDDLLFFSPVNGRLVTRNLTGDESFNVRNGLIAHHQTLPLLVGASPTSSALSLVSFDNKTDI